MVFVMIISGFNVRYSRAYTVYLGIGGLLVAFSIIFLLIEAISSTTIVSAHTAA